jgi:Tfp pilus assembly protein PilX
MTDINPKRDTKESGYVVLASGIMLLLGIAISALLTAKSMSIEQKVQNNEYHSQQSFEAAEAGIEFGLAYLNSNKPSIIVDSNNNGFIDAFTNAQITNVAFANNTAFSILYTNPVGTNFSIIQIASIGTADNGNNSNVISVIAKLFPFDASTPQAGLIARGGVNLSGNVTITNTSTGTTIWSGGATALSGSASTAGTNGQVSNSGSIGADVVQNDANLSSLSGDQFFSGTFGQTKAQAQSSADVTYTNSGSTNYSSLLNGVTGQSIWINQTGGSSAQLSGNSVIGSPTKPVVLVVNGPLQANGTTTIYGIVYVIGDWDNSGGGTLTINGSAIVEGSMTGTGTPNINYTPDIFNNLTQTVGTYVKVPGSWRDF